MARDELPHLVCPQPLPADLLPACQSPTLFYLGITATASSIMQIFPRWRTLLGLGDCVIRGIDLPHPCDSALYRAFLTRLAADELARGAVVTSHKIDLYTAGRDAFDELDASARDLGEVSCIVQRGGRLAGWALDPVAGGLALEELLPAAHWERSGAWVLLLGAGGSARAISLYLAGEKSGRDRPARILVSDTRASRLQEMAELHARLGLEVPLELARVASPGENDALVARLPAGSVIVNATGIGKDVPGSPLSDDVFFPSGSWVWDFNARGDLGMLTQARRQAAETDLHVVDGWRYFLHGWTRHLAAIFEIAIPSRGPQFEALAIAAATCR